MAGAPDLEALANRFDPESRDTYLSLFLDRTDARARTLLDDRAKVIRSALGDRAKVTAFDRAYKEALRALDGVEGTKGAAVFAAPEHAFLEAHALAVPVATALVLDSSPYIRPLARIADEHAAFVLVLLDGARGAVYVVEQGRAASKGERETDLIGRHRHGGMSQRRYQRCREGVENRFYDEVAEVVAGILREGEADRVIVAGPGHPKKQFVARVPKAVEAAIVAVEDVDFNDAGDDALIRRFVDVAHAVEAKESEEAIAALRSELLRGSLATTGAFHVVRAAQQGRVEMLVVLRDAAAGGAKCELHQAFFALGARCECGSVGTDVDLVNEAIEYCVKAESRVEFVDEDDFLASIGGVGAILRW